MTSDLMPIPTPTSYLLLLPSSQPQSCRLFLVFPTPELLSIFHIPFSFPTLELYVTLLQPQCCYPFSILRVVVTVLINQPHSCVSTFPYPNLRVVSPFPTSVLSPFSSLRVVAPFLHPASDLMVVHFQPLLSPLLQPQCCRPIINLRVVVTFSYYSNFRVVCCLSLPQPQSCYQRCCLPFIFQPQS